MIFHQNLQQQLSGNNMKIHKNQIFCFFFLIIVNISYSQNKVKFGYHTPTGEVISLDTQQIQQILQPNKSLPIDNELIDSVLNDSDSIFT